MESYMREIREKFSLFAKGMYELDVISSVFIAQKRAYDFSEYRRQLEAIGPDGDSQVIFNIMDEFGRYIDSLNIAYIEELSDHPLTENQHLLLDSYLNVCSGKKCEITGKLDCLESVKKLRDTCIEYKYTGKPVTQDIIELAAQLELEIFHIIANKN